MRIDIENRVRYSADLGVWTVDMQTLHSVGAGQTLGIAMHFAREAGELPGCTCFPEESVYAGPRAGVQTTPPDVHEVHRRGGLVVFGHGSMADATLNAMQCPHANGEGEARAKALALGDLGSLWEATDPFPTLPPVLLPTTGKRPAVWTGEPVDLGGGRSVPARHVPADVRAEAAKYATLRAEIDGLARAARDAETAKETAPADARTLVAQAAESGKRLDAEAVSRFIRERNEAADAARAVADGMAQAGDKVRQNVTAGVADSKDEWLAYLHAHAAHNLGRLDAIAADLAEVLEELAEIDRLRQTAEGAPGLFSAGSTLATGNAVETVKQAREQAAATLAPLALVVAKQETAKQETAKAAA